ncbi:MAG TPA: hypothetical protein PLZ55_04360 [bacterium]|nr:hypothetical protein [bacterium]HPO07877.1 hypothetical protein [bacterium]HQP99427.1 hypothetical protein [bacterium]
METKNFKVMGWLRSIREEHAKAIEKGTWEEVQRETGVAAQEMRERIEKRRKSQSTLSPT